MQNQTSTSGNNAPSKSPNQIILAVFERAKLIMTDPKGCWGIIKNESGDLKSIFMNWVIPAVGISSVASILGIVIWGISGFGVSYKPGVGYALQFGLSMLLSQCLTVIVSAQMFSFLAPKFGAQISLESASRLVGYSLAPAFASGLLYLLPIPGSTIISLALSVYSIYILFCGVETMSGVSKEKKGIFTGASIVASLIAMFLINMILYGFLGLNQVVPSNISDGQINIGDTSIDTKQLEDFAKQLEKFAPKE